MRLLITFIFIFVFNLNFTYAEQSEEKVPTISTNSLEIGPYDVLMRIKNKM